MKKFYLLQLLLVPLCFSIFSSSINAQTTQWVQYSSGNEVRSLAEEGDVLWVGTLAGLVEYDRITGIPVVYNTANSGLPRNHVADIEVDENGVKWMVTNFKVVEFNGTDWTVHDEVVDPSCIELDSDGNKWIGTWGGLVRYDGESFTMFDTANSSIPGDIVTALAIENDTLWIVTLGTQSEVELTKFDGTNWTTIDIPNYVVRAIEVKDGEVWMGTNGWGLIHYDGTEVIELNDEIGFPYDNIVSIAIDDSNHVWAGAFGNLLVYDGVTWDSVAVAADLTYPTSQEITAILIDSTGNKWIGYENSGVVRLEGEDATMINTSNSSIRFNLVQDMAIDNDTMWVAEYWNGLLRFDGTEWITYDTLNSDLPSNLLQEVEVDQDGVVWIGTQESGLVKFDGESWVNYSAENSELPGNDIIDLAIDQNGAVWVATRLGGLAVLEGDEWTIYNSSNAPILGNVIRSIKMDDNGNVWVGGTNLLKFDGTSWTSYLAFNFDIFDIDLDSSGDVWVASGEGLKRFNGTDWITYDVANSDLPDDWLTAINIDNDDVIWISSIGRLTRFDGTLWTVFTSENSGMVLTQVSSILIDANNTKWLSAGILAGYNDNGIFTPVRTINNAQDHLSIFPNPGSNQVEIQLGSGSTITGLELYDINGRVVKSMIGGNDRMKLDTHDLPSGLYIVRLRTDKGLFAEKLIIK